MSTSNILGSIVGAGAILSLLNKTGATKVTTDLLQSGSIVTAAGGILSASSTISDSLSGVAAGIESSIASVETSISSTISSLETSIANTVDNAANTVSNSLTSISNTVSNAINAISNFSISDTVSSIENFSVTDTITALQNSAKTWASSTVPGVSASGIPAIPAYSATPQNMQNYTMNRNFAFALNFGNSW